MNTKFCVVLLLAVSCQAAPAADAEADPQLYAAGPLLAHAAPVAPNCVVENEILTTQTCTPTTENVCSKQVVDTEEIEYEKVCKDVVDVLCDGPLVAAAPAAAVAAPAVVVKREADAEADPHYFGYGAVPVAHAVAHSAVATVKHSCREVTTQHCVDNPVVKSVPVEVEHCHVVTKVACAAVENPIPKTTCTPVETTHVAAASYAYPGHYYGK